jgi:SHS2 domain-containing protein
MKKFEFLSHTADVKFKAYGKTLNQIFENSVEAFSFIATRGRKVKHLKKRKITLEGDDNESLLYKLMDELIFLIDAKGFLVSSSKLIVKDSKLKGELKGDNSKNYKGMESIKSATYAEMYVKKTNNGYEAQVVLDV